MLNAQGSMDSQSPKPRAQRHRRKIPFMEMPQIAAVVIMVLFVLAVLRARRRRGRILGDPGPGTAGAIYDMLNEDKRKAIEIIVEEKAEATDPETADGNLPELESPGRPRA